MKRKKINKFIENENNSQAKIIPTIMVQPSQKNSKLSDNLGQQLNNIPGLKNSVINKSNPIDKSFYSRYKTDFKEVELLGNHHYLFLK
jgi:hypothetical protein